MILEKDKVYKVRHDRCMFEDDFPRDYIIFSPKNNVFIPSDFFTSVKFPYRNDRSFKTNFTVMLMIIQKQSMLTLILKSL